MKERRFARALRLTLSAWSIVSMGNLARAQTAPEVVAPAPLAPIQVEYPSDAHGDAEVVLELLVAEDGTVAEAKVRDGAEPFASAARRATASFRFRAASRSGIPIRARIAVRIGFQEPTPEAPPNLTGVTPELDSAVPVDTSAPIATGRRSAPANPEPPTVEISVLGEQPTELGSIHVPKEEARRVPGAFGDPFRVVEVLPGVVPMESGVPYFYVRGASPGSVGYFIDGIPVPVLFHIGPGPSVIAPALIDRVELFPGPYPARFDRFAGAIFAGETSTPSERGRAEGQVRVFDSSAMLEQPFANGRGSALVAGRYSYLQAILAAVAPDYKLNYGDYQARIGYAVSTSDRLTLFAFGGFDLLKNQKLGITVFDVGFHRLDLRWDHITQPSHLRVAATLSSDTVLTTPENVGAPGSAKRTRGVRLRTEFEQRIAPDFRFRAGADLGVLAVTDDREQIQTTYRAYPDRADVAGGVYADLVWRPLRGTELVPGGRIDIERSRGETYTFFDPRLSTRTRLAEGVSYLGGFGLAHELPSNAIRVPGRVPNLIELSRQRSVQATQGLEYVLPDGMLARTTVFHRFVDIDTAGVNGRSYGVEQFIHRDFTHRFGGFLSYTLSRAEGKVANQTVLSSYDRTHVVSAVLGYDFGRGFRFGVHGNYESGRAYQVGCPTPGCGPGDPTAPRQYSKNLRLPGFFRLDLRFERRWQFASGAWLTGTFEWFNALLASEVLNVNYTATGLVEDRQSPLTLPSIGIEFGY